MERLGLTYLLDTMSVYLPPNILSLKLVSLGAVNLYLICPFCKLTKESSIYLIQNNKSAEKSIMEKKKIYSPILFPTNNSNKGKRQESVGAIVFSLGQYHYNLFSVKKMVYFNF